MKSKSNLLLKGGLILFGAPVVILIPIFLIGKLLLAVGCLHANDRVVSSFIRMCMAGTMSAVAGFFLLLFYCIKLLFLKLFGKVNSN